MKFDHVVVAVHNLNASLPWYERVMTAIGFTATRDHVWVNEEGHALELRQAPDPEHAYSRHGVGVNHLAFQAASPAELNQVRQAMIDAGLEAPEAQRFGRDLALFLADRDGMRIELTAYGPER